MHTEDRELQIELVNLQIDHEFLTSFFMGILAIQFGVLIGFASIYYAVYTNPQYLILSMGLIVGIFVLVISIYRTVRRYENKRKEIKQRIQKLREKYVWWD